ncbi:MAG: extracellular solute-binding protein [Deltaproteobacteria bacterium]|nr:extracellular solute-binding protein [Deltaproteobacteria bacterium]
MKLSTTILGAAAFLALAFLQSVAPLGSNSLAASATDFKKVLEGARKEGKLIVWVSTPNREKTHRLLLDAFNKRFGLQTRWEWVAMHPTQSVTRVITEASAGRVNPDVLGAGGFGQVMKLVETNLVKAYPWVDVFGKELPNIGEPEGRVVKELRGMMLSWFDNTYGVAWNTKMIGDDKIPDRLEQFADPQWQGRLIVNVAGGSPFDILSLAMGTAKALELARKIEVTRPILKKGTPAVNAALTAGEAPAGLSSFFNAERAIKNGEPQRFKFFQNYIPVSPLHIYVPEGSPNPNMARLFAAWLVTEGAPIFEREEIGGRYTDPRSKLAQFIKQRAGKAEMLVPRNLQEVKQVESLADELSMMFTGKR